MDERRTDTESAKAGVEKSFDDLNAERIAFAEYISSLTACMIL